MKPFDKKMPGILIELKVLSANVKEENLDAELGDFASIALKQIDEKQYISQMRKKGIKKFLKIGIAFYKKHVKLQSQIE